MTTERHRSHWRLRTGPRALFVAAMLIGSSARASAPSPETPAAESADTVDAAIERGDLDRARALAKAQREKDPSAANWRTEAEVLELAGDVDGAIAARRGQVATLPKGAERAKAQAELDRLREQARGRVGDEPASTHRKDLDARWQAASAPSGKPKSKGTIASPSERRSPDERVVNKWYFWVTLAAIVASAAAVTGIAIKASRDDKPDSLDTLVPTSRPTGGAGFRF